MEGQSMPQTERERDMVLDHTQQAFTLDETTGTITAYIGPSKTALGDANKPVHLENGKFSKCQLHQAVQTFPTAPEGSYIVLENPSAKEDSPHPLPGKANQLVPLNMGRKINMPGPVQFPLWPGQIATVVEGHRLRSNQYLIVRIYNEEEATKNWTSGVVKPAAGDDDDKDDTSISERPDDLTIGQLLIIKGTKVSFYIPPTGVEVVADSEFASATYVRAAVTLERLEYCVLLDENGAKRYVRGPDVVFPKPTETFVTGSESFIRKFRAFELNKDMGLYIKVIADYNEGEDEDGKKVKAGEELFVTGADQKIYYPRAEHALIKYGDREIHFATAIPAGEGRYVLDKNTGAINTIKGPKMFLPDPRKEVMVRKVLDPKVINLLYPNNAEAMQHNTALRKMSKGSSGFVTDRQYRTTCGMMDEPLAATMLDAVDEAWGGDEMTRSATYTKPNMIQLDSKYDGVVAVDVWTGYAVQVVSKTGKRRVVVGPETVLLDYDESLEKLTLSTGKPKTTDRLLETVYLLTHNNKVSDIVNAETKDLVKVKVKVSYRVNFEGEPKKWFSVENYVKLLCDHVRSKMRNAIKKVGIEEFNNNSIDIVRNTILGMPVEGKGRPGQKFVDDNGMHVHEVEVLDVVIGDDRIANMLITAQHTAVEQTIQISADNKNLEVVKKHETIQQQINDAKHETREQELGLSKKESALVSDVALAKIAADEERAAERRKSLVADQKNADKIETMRLETQKARSEHALKVQSEEQQLAIALILKEAEAVKAKAGAITPQLVAAIQTLGDKQLAVTMAEASAPMAILGGKSLVEVATKIFSGTGFEGLIAQNFFGRSDRKAGKVTTPAPATK
jgi:major vault protein